MPSKYRALLIATLFLPASNFESLNQIKVNCILIVSPKYIMGRGGGGELVIRKNLNLLWLQVLQHRLATYQVWHAFFGYKQLART